MSDRLKDMQHPMQPIGYDERNTIRFKRNAIVRFLLNWATERGMGLNEIAVMDFESGDRCQFAQLIGYSVSGFGELSYNEGFGDVVAEADAKAAELRKPPRAEVQ